jgi:hypothetical protein
MTGRLQNGKIDRLFVSDMDPEYYYRWANTKDINVMSMQLDGFEPVVGEDPKMSLTPLPVAGQSTENPVSAGSRMRGDLVLMRIRKEAYEETIGEELRAARDRQSVSLDTMVQQANENARNAAKQAGLKNVPKQLVFREE